MRRTLVALLMVFLFSVSSLSIGDNEADKRAKQLWGKGGLAFRFKTSGRGGKWIYQVGCRLNKVFILVGEGDTWEKAFDDVNMYLNGPNLTWAKGVYMCTSIRLGISVADPD